MAASSSSLGEIWEDDPISNFAKLTVGESTDLDVHKWGTLDDHLLEKIISRLPIKFLFQALSLSKAWRLRFQSPTFESEVQKSSSSWKSYAPLMVNSEKALIGYERCSKCWHKLPPHTYIKSDVWQKHKWGLRAAHGSLLCWESSDVPGIIYVTNPLTRSFRELPRPHMSLPFDIVHIVCDGKRAYNIILGKLINFRDQTWIEMEIFHSTNATWTVESYNTELEERNEFLGGSVILEGVLYMVLYNDMITFPLYNGTSYSVVSFHLNQKIWKKITKFKDNLVFSNPPWLWSQLMVCGLDVIWVIGSYTAQGLVVYTVLRIELESGSVTELSTARPDLLFDRRYEAFSQGDYICIGGPDPLYCIWWDNPELTKEWNWTEWCIFDLRSAKWNKISSPSESQVGSDQLSFYQSRCQTRTSYEPGLCPLFEV